GGDVSSSVKRQLAGLFAPVLTAIQHREADKVPIAEVAVQPQGSVVGNRARAQGHVLVVGLVGGGPPAEERFGCCHRYLRPLVGIVVLDLMVIPRDDGGRRRVEGLQVRVCLVESVAVPVAREVGGRRAVVGAKHLGGVQYPVGEFIDVVAKKQDEVRI